MEKVIIYLKPINGVSDTNWYNKKIGDYEFDEEAIRWLDTRNIINGVINKWGYSKGHNIYRNIGNVFGEVFLLGGYENSLPYISFYNYFLRPAEITGESINYD